MTDCNATAPLCSLKNLTGVHSIQLLHKLQDVRRCPCSRLPERGLVVDGGTADDAADAIAWLSALKGWEAVGFEAAPLRCRNAAAKTKRFGSRAALQCKALSDKLGTATFTLEAQQQGSLRNTTAGANAVSVETTTLDHEFQHHRRSIFLLKLDLQGAEVLALRGAANLLRSQRITYMYVEFDPNLLRESGTSAAEYLALLHSHGYACHNFRRRYTQPWLCNYKLASGRADACWTNLLCAIPSGVQEVDSAIPTQTWQGVLMRSFCKRQGSHNAIQDCSNITLS